MKKFMDDDFLLSTDTAKELFRAAKEMPVFDWHCHLSPKEIYDNKNPDDIAELWLSYDHYKWRAMRSALTKNISRATPTAMISLRRGLKQCHIL